MVVSRWVENIGILYDLDYDDMPSFIQLIAWYDSIALMVTLNITTRRSLRPTCAPFFRANKSMF